ncbi:positive regulator of sigma(E), RseC/MucC [Geoalkalibacter ferrihydriticus]|uniref:Positive regulator of sigma(E), RseC/MucC n=1 Tax=Geoalkalibacter ferrihydriticus TaxID=392333 RepID=A0A1G9KWD4_9BACT|nr:SoxR reducing system RseC family protein [Geoalkalibacter ferrihydriticus]SDL54022.1 positive regulator of sigma(E), RseC/MucC [Geoalkalibacter ferrihydriticus]
MLEETGTVIEIKDGQTAVVLCSKSSMCESCAAMDSCRIGDDSGERLVEARNLLNAVIGDHVRIATSTRSFLQSSFVLYMLPLVFLVTGAIVGQLLAERIDAGIDPNLLSALFGVACLILSFLGIRLWSRTIPAENFMPWITEVLSDATAFNKDKNHGN